MSPEAFLKRLYAAIKYRTSSRKRPKYCGLALCTKEEFMEFGKQETFKTLFAAWVEAGCPRRLVPTADRIDPNRGYEIDNISWKSLGENSRRARFELRRKPSGLPVGVRSKRNKYSARIRNNYKETPLGVFDTPEQAHNAYLTAKRAQGR